MNLNELGNYINDNATQGSKGFAFRVRDRPRRSLEKTELFDILTYVLDDNQQAELQIATDFWQAFLMSGAILTPSIMKVLPLGVGNFDRIMLHHSVTQPTYDLLILSSTCDKLEGYKIELSDLFLRGELYGEIFFAWQETQQRLKIRLMKMGRYFSSLESDKMVDFIEQLGSQRFFRELIYFVDFSILIGPMPKMISTSGLPSPACGIGLDASSKAISSVGVFGENESGIKGVTGSLHGVVADTEKLHEEYNKSGRDCVLNTEVYVDGKKGIIRDADLITDSCFIEIPDNLAATYRLVSPMLNRLPGNEEEVSFDGLTSKLKNTVVMKIDPGLNFVDRSRQLRIYTPAVTNKGDSGAALYNTSNEIIGFCHWRTGYGEQIQFSEWIWARSVYKSLKLKII